jgi:hypothetical protein
LRRRPRLVVAGDARAAIEDPGAALGDGAVKRDEFRIEVAARLRLRHEMVMAILAAHERGAVLAGELRHASRDIADGKADAPVVRWVGRRAVNETHVAQWSDVKRTSGQGSIAIRTAIAAASQGKTVGR